MGVSRASALLLAVGLDLLVGEPPERWHPVVWMGRLVARLEREAPRDGAERQLAFGAGMEAACLAAAVAPAWAAGRLLAGRGPLGIVATALLLKPAFAARALFEHGQAVERALKHGDLPKARKAVGMIVSRDVQDLDESLVAAAATESLAENCSDSVVAPLLLYSVLGLPGAYLYRMANTLDAMIGYRGKYEYLGKVAARLDDLLNVAPSRLAALAVAACSGVAGGSPREAWLAARRDHDVTASPNAGWPMAAAAGALGVRLEKVGHYTLNPGGRLPAAADIGRARRLVGASIALTVLAASLISAMSGRGGRKSGEGAREK